MKHLTAALLWPVTVVVMIFGFAITVSASAAPEIGRCQAAKDGKYANSACTLEASGKPGAFEWHEGPLERNKFTATSGTSVVWGGGTKAPVTECKEDTMTGTVVPGPLGFKSIHITYTGCELNGLECSSFGQPFGTIVTNTVESNLGVTKVTNGRPTGFGGKFHPEEEPKQLVLETFECGPTVFTVTGGAIAKLGPANKMVPGLTATFQGNKGIQKPGSFVGGEPVSLSVQAGGGAPEKAGLTSTEKITFEEPLELRDLG